MAVAYCVLAWLAAAVAVGMHRGFFAPTIHWAHALAYSVAFTAPTFWTGYLPAWALGAGLLGRALWALASVATFAALHLTTS